MTTETIEAVECECNGGDPCDDCPDCDHADCSYRCKTYGCRECGGEHDWTDEQRREHDERIGDPR